MDALVDPVILASSGCGTDRANPRTASFSVSTPRDSGRLLERRFGTPYFQKLVEQVLSDQKYARFCGPDAEPDEKRGHVENGGGVALRCVHSRTNKTDAVLLFDARSSGRNDSFSGNAGGVGCWNPAEHASAGNFREGDALRFPDLEVMSQSAQTSATAVPSFPALVADSVEKNTGTGWNLPGLGSRFGRCGVVGDWRRCLELEFAFERLPLVAGVCTDAPTRETPCNWLWYAAATGLSRRTGTNSRPEPWRPAAAAGGSAEPASPFAFADEPGPVWRARVRGRWETTDLHELGGLRTARSGGGMHVHPVGPPTGYPTMVAAQSGAASSSRAAALVEQAAARAGDSLRVAVAPAPAAAGGDDGWWSSNAKAGAEIYSARAASSADQRADVKFPQI